MTPSTPENLARMRKEYGGAFAEDDLAPGWVAQFGRWFGDATAAGLLEPNAMVLATADGRGRPSARTVLLKSYDERGFVFYTNYTSRKGRDLLANPHASAVFGWLALHRQVIVTGPVQPVSREETAEYFAVRPRGAQLGAWASPQSSVLTSRKELEEAAAEVAERFAGREVPPPPHWGGFRITPQAVEFWQGRDSRLHDRIRFRHDPSAGSGWTIERLAP